MNAVTAWCKEHSKFSPQLVRRQMRLNGSSAPYDMNEVEAVMANYQVDKKNRDVERQARQR